MTCHRGHATTETTSRGTCAECARENSRARYARRREAWAQVERLEDQGKLLTVVPERLHRARVVACLSLEELADQVGVTHVHLSDAEATGKIREGALEIISDITGRPIEWFSRPWPADRWPELEHVAVWITACREALGMSASDLAREIGTDLSTVRRWEVGEKSPNPRSLRRLRSALVGAPWPPDGAK